jgi:hypothetical protein
VLGGGGDCEHEFWVDAHPRVQDPKAAGIQAELCDEECVMRKDWYTNDQRSWRGIMQLCDWLLW